MKLFAAHRSLVAGVVLAALVMATMASLAEAGRGNGRKYKHRGGKRVVRVYESPRVYHHYSSRGSSAGPAIAGFVGGLILGTVLSEHANASARVSVGHTYWDPYCAEPYPSMDAYHAHCRSHSHGTRVRVVQIPDGYSWDDYRCGHDGQPYWSRNADYRDHDYRDYRDDRDYRRGDYDDD